MAIIPHGSSQKWEDYLLPVRPLVLWAYTEITDRGYGYIFAYRLKAASNKIQSEIFSGGYTQIQDSDESLSYKVISNTDSFFIDSKKVSLNQKIIITYSEKRAKKDKIDKAENLLEDFSNL